MKDHPESKALLPQAKNAQGVEDGWLQHFSKLVSFQTGLHIIEQDIEKFRKLISSRMKLLTLPDPEKYHRLLEANSPESQREWQELAMRLTTGESYFFRDQGQFALLKNSILPELIERRKSQRALRIWSAGCATGEEAYSLAILVDELLPQRDDWHILILGTDLNSAAIEKARRGVYSAWSFRMVHADLQGRYFHRRQAAWELHERLRTMVTLRAGNLLKETFPSHTSDLRAMDLILCRHVFLYFAPEAVSVVLAKFTETLRDGGYLLTGHNELHGQHLGWLRPRVWPEAVLYQRPEDPQKPRHPDAIPDRVPAVPWWPRASAASSAPAGSTAPAQDTSSPSLLSEAHMLWRDGAYAAALVQAARVLNDDRHPERSRVHFEAHYLMAQAYANLGQHDQAARCCRQALAIAPFALHPYYLLAHIAEDQGDLSAAKDFWKKVLYLSPSCIAAYLELGALYAREHDAVRARKMRTTALELLQALPPQVPIEPYAGLTAGELLHYVQKEIEGGSHV